MKKWLILTVIGIAAVIYVDNKIADQINERLLPVVMIYQDRLPPEGLNFEGPLLQGCRLEHVYYVYTYQTCFVLRSWYVPNGAFFQYVYHRPVAALAFYGRDGNSSYFGAMELGERLARINEPE
jgi:hypothetical protein